MSTSTYTLLIVEDFLADRELYRRSLLADSNCTYSVLDAESVAEGLAICQGQKIDAVLLDYGLPDADGLEFLERLAAQSHGNIPAVVMLTGQGNENIAVRALKLGAQDYLVKRDLTPELLQLTLRKEIANHRLRRQLQQCQERFKMSIDNMRECVSIFSAIRDAAGEIIDFRFDYLNPAALANNRMTAKDIGRSLCEVFPAFGSSGLFEEYCQMVATGQPLIKEQLVYEDVFDGERLTRVYSVYASKLDDGFVSCWRDETAKTKAQQELQAADRKIIEIWESMTDAYVMLDRDWRVIYTNSAATEVYLQTTGLLPAAYLGKSHWEVFPWTVGTIVEREYRRAVAEGVAVHFEIFYEPTETWFEIHAYPSTEGLGLYFQDITQRKLDELARIAAEAQRDRFFNLSLDLLAIGNFEGYFERINPAFVRLLGFTEAEFLARPFIDFVHPDDREATVAGAQSLERGEIVVDFENRCQCKDGSYVWISWSATPYQQSSCWYGVGRDISLRKREQAQIQQAEATIRAQLGEIESIYRTAPVGLSVIDTNLQYVRINEQLAQIDGLSVAEHIGRTIREVVPEMADRLEPLYRQVIESGEPILNLELSGTVPSQPGVERYWLVCYYPQKDGADRVVSVNVMVQEITDRKQMEAERLAATQERDRFFSLSIDLLATIDFNGYFTRLNPVWEETLGYTHAELMARPFIEFVHPDDRERSIAAAQKVGVGELVISFENRYICKDGSYRWLLWNAIPDLEQNRMYASAHDITERKRMEAERLAATQERDRFFNLSIDLLGIANFDGYFTRVNPAFERVLGFTTAELTSQPFIEFVHPDDRATTAAAAQQLIAGDILVSFENRYRCQDGSYRWLLWSAMPDLKQNLMYASAHDITERKQMEIERIAAEQERDRFFNLSLDLLAIGNFDGYFTRLNPAFEQILGFTNAELMAEPFVNFVHPDDRELTIAGVGALTQGDRRVVNVENRYRCQDGSYRWISWNAVSHIPSQLWYTIGQDITERKQLEADRLEAEQDRDRFFNLSIDLLVIGSFDGYFTRLNPAWEQILGLTRAELMAEPFINFVHPDDRELTLAAAQSLIDGTPMISCENRYRCKDGSYRWVSWNAIPYAPNQVWYAIGHDVTERKQAEVALQESERKFSAIFNQTFELIGLLSVDGILLEVNLAALDAIEAQSSDVIGREFWDTLWWNHSPVAQELVKEAIERGASGEFSRFQIQLPTPIDTVVDIDVSLKPIFDEAGNVTMMLAEGRDITDLKQSERSLQASERKFGAIFEQSFELMGIVSLDGVLLEVNQTALDSIAARKEDIAGEYFWDTPWWQTEPLQQQLKAAVDRAVNGKFSRYEVQFAAPNGTTVTTDFSMKPVFDEADRVVMMVAEAHDITDRKRAERDLREAQERLQAGIEVAGVGLARFDYTTNLVALSPEAAVMYGFPADTSFVTREQIHATFHPDQRAELEATIAQVIDPAGTGWFAEDHQVVWPSGEVRCLSVRKQVFFDRSGEVARPSYAILAAIDISLRKQTERELAESEERLRTGIEVAGVGLARFDYATNLVALSPEAAFLFGFAPGTSVVTREQIHDTFHPDERDELEAIIAQVVEPTGTGWFARDHRVVWPNGEVRYLSVRKQVFFDRVGGMGCPSHAILAAIDITERKQTLATLEARNQELDSFVHIVSHDLKAPLRAVANLSKWIEEDLQGSLTPSTQDQMNMLRGRVDRMSATIDGLLDYARIGRTEDSIESVAVSELIAETIDTLAPPPTFTIAIAQSLPTLYTKRMLLSQVFANLLGNAIKHHDRVDGMIHLGIAERTEYYEFAIADDGPGIAPEDRDRVFKIFQAVNPQKRNDSTGIGLAIVKKIVEAEGGTIRLESQPGRGTTFYFTWPKRS